MPSNGSKIITDHRVIWAAGDTYKFLALGSDTNGAYSLWHATIPPGGGPPLHVHFGEDERFDVLKGEITFYLGQEHLDEGKVFEDPSAYGKLPLKKFVASAGTSMYGPRNFSHAFSNNSDEPAEMLLHLTPGGMEEFFFETGVAATPGGSPPEGPPTPEQRKKLVECAAKYGVAILGPPPAHSEH